MFSQSKSERQRGGVGGGGGGGGGGGVFMGNVCDQRDSSA